LFAFLAGLTFAGLAGSAMELMFRQPISLGMPFISQDRILRSLGLTLLAGPLMLANELLAAWRIGKIGLPMLVFCTGAACLRASAAGILILELAFWLAGLLG
jgi:hypothetical protein